MASSTFALDYLLGISARKDSKDGSAFDVVSVLAAITVADPQAKFAETAVEGLEGGAVCVRLSSSALMGQAELQELTMITRAGTSLPFKREYASLFPLSGSGDIFSTAERVQLTHAFLERVQLTVPGGGAHRTDEPLSRHWLPSGTDADEEATSPPAATGMDTGNTIGSAMCDGRIVAVPLHSSRELSYLRRVWVQQRSAAPAASSAAPPAAGVAAAEASSHRASRYLNRCISWITQSLSLEQPLDAVREYYGEAITFYFAFTAFYARSLILPAALGLLLYLHQWLSQSKVAAAGSGRSKAHSNSSGSGAFDGASVLTVLYALVVAWWASIFMKLWRRRQSELAFRWATLGQAAADKPRPGYKNNRMSINPISGAAEPDESLKSHLLRYMLVSLPGMVASAVGSLAVIGLLETLRVVITHDTQPYLDQHASASAQLSGMERLFHQKAAHYLLPAPWKLMREWVIPLLKFVPTILYAVGIPILTAVNTSIARRLTEVENHRTEKDWSEAYVSKLVLSNSIYTFGPLLYIAFAEQNLELLRERLLWMVRLTRSCFHPALATKSSSLTAFQSCPCSPS